MKNSNFKQLLLGTSLLMGSLAFAGQAWAQDNGADQSGAEKTMPAEKSMDDAMMDDGMDMPAEGMDGAMMDDGMDDTMMDDGMDDTMMDDGMDMPAEGMDGAMMDDGMDMPAEGMDGAMMDDGMDMPAEGMDGAMMDDGMDMPAEGMDGAMMDDGMDMPAEGMDGAMMDDGMDMPAEGMDGAMMDDGMDMPAEGMDGAMMDDGMDMPAEGMDGAMMDDGMDMPAEKSMDDAMMDDGMDMPAEGMDGAMMDDGMDMPAEGMDGAMMDDGMDDTMMDDGMDMPAEGMDGAMMDDGMDMPAEGMDGAMMDDGMDDTMMDDGMDMPAESMDGAMMDDGMDMPAESMDGAMMDDDMDMPAEGMDGAMMDDGMDMPAEGMDGAMMDDGMDMPDESMDSEESEPATPAASVDDANAEEITPPESTTAATDSDTIIVTGSRIKRTVFSSISPLQVITSETSVKAGLIDPAQILQTSEAAAGTQIDATFQGFVLDNGPGSQTLNLRDFDPQRTLVLLNGRRLAPSGVEGAPVSASINTIPGSLVDRYDLLLDGASSIYGSDAIAGVVNVILRKDFDGFEVDGFVGTTEQGGNTDYTISGNWGGNTDRGFIGIGVEYDYRDEVTLADRDFLNDCEKHVEIDTNGNIRNRDIFDEVRFDVWYDGFQAADGDGPLGECVTDGISGRLFEDSGTFGSIYRVAGTETNIGQPGYIDQNLNSIPIDADGDGVQDYGFQEFSINGTRLDQSFISEQKRASILSYGEYTFEGESNLTPFYEILYTDTRIFADSGQGQLFPDVPATNPFNPCRSGALSLDCGSASFNFDDAFIQRWNTYYRDRDPNRDGDTSDARICATFGGGRFDNAACTPFLFGFGPSDIVGATEVTPIVAIDGDRDKTDTTFKNLRFTAGVKGDLLFMNSGQFSNWTFEASVSHSASKGISDREGIREDRLNFALGVDPNNPFSFDADGDQFLNPTPGPCMPNPDSPVTADVADGCVPVDLFNEAVALNTVGDFATAAERDYLFDLRHFETEYKQTLVQGYMTGNVASLPAGSIGAVIGGEIRIDEINSIPNDVAAEGLLFGFFIDRGAVGKKTTTEVYGELDVPLVADKTLFRQLDFNISGRITDDEFYGTNGTYSVKGGWRPFDSLLLKGSLGTSFRAPNLRENFLLGQSGFTNVFDPCVVPTAARGGSLTRNDQVYQPSEDQRDPSVLDICRREGVDPTSLGLNTGNTGTTQYEIFRIGSLDLEPETSKSISLGFAFDQPWTDAFDLDINASYYRLDLSDAIIELSGGFIVGSCYFAQEVSRNSFCDNITRRNGTSFITEIDAGFDNITQDLVRGVDYNIRFAKEFNAFDTPMELILNVRANQLIERSFSNRDDDGSIFFSEIQGEFGLPKWRGRIIADLDIDAKWNLTWTTRFIDSVAQDPDFVDDFGDALGTSGTFASTCGGVFVGDVTCRDVGFADDYWEHAASLSYRTDTLLITAGASNIFNTDPPEVDGNEVLSVSNVPIGNGYNLAGRRFFMRVQKSF